MGLKSFFFKEEDDDKDTNQLVGFKFYEIIIIILIAILIGLVSGLHIGSYYAEKSLEKEKKTETQDPSLNQLSTISDWISDNYFEKISKEELLEAAIEGMIDYVGDPHTSYLTPQEKKDFDERMGGEYRGIGIELTSDKEEKNIFIINVFPNSPAATAGLQVGDIIIAVDKKETKKMTTAEIASYIKEGKSKKVDITVKREKKTLTKTVDKKKVTIPSVETEMFKENNKKIGYIFISLFANNTYEQFRRAVLDFEDEKIDSLIIDVRSNSGGYLNSVVEMMSMFLPKDSIIYQIKVQDNIKKHYTKTKEYRDYPVVVLINEYSASASEILAGAFKEVYKAEIVGKTSFGKGSVQETRNLENGGMLKITTQSWLTPLGNSIEGKGIEPTIEVDLGKEYLNNPSSENDNQLQKAIEILKK